MTDARMQGLRDLLAALLRDFDSHGGGFSGISYNSPWLMATDFWAKRSGCFVDELKEMITKIRSADLCGIKPDNKNREIFENFKKAVESWRLEVDYSTSPLRLTSNDMKISNYRHLKPYIFNTIPSMNLDHPTVEFDGSDLVFSGFLNDRFGHRVSMRMSVKTRYGGKIWLSFRFPYFGQGEPALLTHNDLTALTLRNQVNFPEIPELDWIAPREHTNSDIIDSVLGIIRAISQYLIPTWH
ncbi:hypothetical protein FJV83_00940 [Mesorhizobium sp. WSM4307]|uniref:hypothetical protein n=1 Tax=unclassified Mesorhizobium TaxID=325217 RepID=UPI00115F23B8|nr:MULTISPECIES: hypothetical protein [unclassified Mesorhizobium]TRC72291.1 hypothetical protein FJV81_29455 [Mesorhizobium sp. WSM4315]TRC88274.1 hypothetical protein FJV83_00940 [Mesorhizobium sp. WSM4307]